jgi:predicted porin
MKKVKLLALTSIALSVQGAFAQSSVTLYGISDVAIRYATNQTAGTGAANRLFMTDGAMTGSRWGLRGTEDLGGGTSAIFDLESGFSLTNGAFGQQGQLFGRQAYVGLSNGTYGTVKIGRQYGGAFDFIAHFDPLAGGNVIPDEWEGSLIGARYDNTVQYSNAFGPVSVELQRSFGNQAGSVTKGSTTVGSFIYSIGSFSTGGFGQQSEDGSNHSLYAGGVAASYKFGPALLQSYYFETRRDAGFTVSPPTTSLPLANTSLTSNVNTAAGAGKQTSARTDHLAMLGGTYLVTPALGLTFAGMYDATTNVAPGESGRTGSLYGIVDYFLSTRTDVYLEADYSHLSGAAVKDPNSPIGQFGGKSSSIGAMLGLRTRF